MSAERFERKEANVNVVVVRHYWAHPDDKGELLLKAEIADVYDDGSIAVKNPDGTTNCIRHNGCWLRKEAFDEYIDAIKNRLVGLKEKKNEE